MPKDDPKKLYDVLELPPDAPLRAVHNSHMRLKKLYSGESIVLEPLGEDFTDKKKKKILEQIEDAYAKILAARKPEAARPEPLFSAELPEEKIPELDDLAGAVFTGPRLRKARDAKNVTLNEISKELKLRLELLNNIEAERFETLPEAIYLKAQLRTYAAFLGLPPAKVADDYLQRYKAWKEKISPPNPEGKARRQRS
jgi:transcriptional regulator with XRE-family HTH domain